MQETDKHVKIFRSRVSGQGNIMPTSETIEN